ncbi:hypothetical protein A2933_00805 [Candidatus Nomurabacteria bacterium RIFCSPLOWO2_01_FULL_46_18]|uniref:Uncharacterized protein n=1 Tax=Candidatus Nomurabacteria bacterium RIFCSPLOWO2_01_FULL_46_18 TaxID=1801783 RepID=A0A1F6XFF5_9BACT|nr:MAG: hypothetical protein A2933_00805 [Candidatus Nomurabacteria bacterium RIFCSPLOWO2_01_FULL_46_18]
MSKNCKNCKKDFKIRDEDLIFYEQIKVPPPNYCPDCRMQRRLAFRNERTLYKRTCDLCKKETISIYPAGTPFPVYDNDCWWSDKWDPLSFGTEYDPKRPFLAQFGELKNKVPRIALLSLRSHNSDYCNNAGENKNCYLIFAAEFNEDCLYSRLIHRSKNCMDCVSLYDSELCYECVDTRKSFKCLYGERIQDSVNVLFSFDMRNCQNCILCTNGRNLSYCIENKQVTREEFEKRKAEILKDYASIEEAKKKYEKVRGSAIVKYAFATKCNNVTGDYIYNCYDGVRIFDATDVKNSSYVADVESPIDCWDCNNIYYKPERCYNVMGSLSNRNSIVCTYPMYSNETHYCDNVHNCESCFGCAGLNKKNYHILNKEYPKEDYEKLRDEIIEQMKKEEIYGEFFPPKLSPFGYNETLAKEYFPMNEKEAKEKGFNWQGAKTGTYGKETIKENEMPETGEELNEGILKEVLVCRDCKKNFRVTKAEFDFYKRMNLPLPRKDFECRHQDRMKKRNPRKLWPSKCMCTIERHGHASTCPNEFETSYSPDRPEAVYCETCYQQEVS